MGIDCGLPQGGWSGEDVHNITVSDKSSIQNCMCYLAQALELKGKPQIIHSAFFFLSDGIMSVVYFLPYSCQFNQKFPSRHNLL